MLKAIFPISFKNLPTTIIIIGIYFSVVNLVMSYIGTAYTNDLAYTDVKRIFSMYTPFNLILLTMSFLVGIGIIGVKRWAFFLYLIFNSILIVHGIYFLIKYWGFQSDILTTDALIYNMILVLVSFGLTLYMLNSEISTPYLTLIPRGFRKKWRTEIPINGILTDGIGNKINITTLDISPTGCLASANGYVFDEGTYDLTFNLDKPWTVKAYIVRTQGENIGLRFDYKNSAENSKKVIKKYLESKLVPRYSITLSGEIQTSSKLLKGEILNISEGGFYITTSEQLNQNEAIDYSFRLYGIRFSGKGIISWINSSSEYNKPSGVGISFQSISKSFLFNFFIFILRLFTHFENRDR